MTKITYYLIFTNYITVCLLTVAQSLWKRCWQLQIPVLNAFRHICGKEMKKGRLKHRRRAPSEREDGRVMGRSAVCSCRSQLVLYFYACRALKITMLPLFFSLTFRPFRSQVTVPANESMGKGSDLTLCTIYTQYTFWENTLQLRKIGRGC